MSKPKLENKLYIRCQTMMLKRLVTCLMLGSMKPQASGLPDVVHLDIRPTNCKPVIGWSLRQIEEEFLLHSLEVLLNGQNYIL